MKDRIKWTTYPAHKPRAPGRYFVTHQEESERYVFLDRFLENGTFASEVVGMKILAWAPIKTPKPYGGKNGTE